MNDLLDTWLDDRVPGVDPVDLKRNGVSFKSAQMCGGVRRGRRGWIVAAFVDPPSIYRTVAEPILEDFCIFDPVRPMRWRTVTGAAVMLGEAALAEARWYGAPLPVYRTPLCWLQSGGGGVFPLDARAFGLAVMAVPEITLIGESVQHGRELRRMVDAARRIGLPKIAVRRAA